MQQEALETQDHEWIIKFSEAAERAGAASGRTRRPRSPADARRRDHQTSGHQAEGVRTGAPPKAIPAGITIFSPDSAGDEPANLAASIEQLFEELEHGIDRLDRNVSAAIAAAGRPHEQGRTG